MYYMKTITTRLPDELVEMLDTLPNKSNFIRSAIESAFNKNEVDDSKYVTKQQVIDLIKQTVGIRQKESMVASSRPTAWSTIQEYPKELPVRSKNDITTEISQLEAERDEKLEYSQDYAENRRITLDYKTQIDALWADYNILKKEQDAQD